MIDSGYLRMPLGLAAVQAGTGGRARGARCSFGAIIGGKNRTICSYANPKKRFWISGQRGPKPDALANRATGRTGASLEVQWLRAGSHFVFDFLGALGTLGAFNPIKSGVPPAGGSERRYGN